MKSIAWAVFSVGCLAISVYASAHGLKADSIGSFVWAVAGLCGLMIQPRA